MREVYVLGVGMSKFGKFKELHPSRLGEIAVKAAIEDVGPEFDPRTMQIAYCGHCEGSSQQGQDILKYVGVSDIEIHNVENACDSGGAAVHNLWKDIAIGYADIGIAIGLDSMTRSKIAGGLVPTAEGDIDGLMGITMPGLLGICSNRLMEVHGFTEEDLAYAAIKNHKNAVHNEFAHFRKEITFEDIKAARMIADPITVLHCCPQSDGAAAVILCTKEVAQKYTSKLIRVNASVCRSSAYKVWNEDIHSYPLLVDLCKRAYESAGVDPLQDVNVVELHDAFSPEELYCYELMGLCKPGESLKFIREGQAEIGGKCAVNPSGGLLSFGHPLGASGVRVMVEITQQLRGQCGLRQQPNAHCGVAQMVGGGLVNLSTPVVGSVAVLTN